MKAILNTRLDFFYSKAITHVIQKILKLMEKKVFVAPCKNRIKCEST